MESETLGIRIMIEIGVCHMKDGTEIEGVVEVLVTVDQGQFQRQLQIDIGSDVLSVENTIILQGTVQIGKQLWKHNKYNKCSMDKDQTILQTPLMDTDQDEQTISPVETRDNLNL